MKSIWLDNTVAQTINIPSINLSTGAVNYVSLDCKEEKAVPACAGNKTMENNMCYDCDEMDETTETERSRQYFRSRLFNVEEQKDYEVRKTFGMLDDPAPTKPSELVERIKSGKYILPIETHPNGKTVYFNPWLISEITWRDPSVVRDEAGYKVALNKLWMARKDAEDLLQSVTAPGEMLKVLEAFQSTTVN